MVKVANDGISRGQIAKRSPTARLTHQKISPHDGESDQKPHEIIMDELHKNGFTIIPNVFSMNTMLELKNAHEKYWEAFKIAIVTNRNGIGFFRGHTVTFLKKGRYDLELDFGIFRSKKLLDNEIITNIVNKTIKSNYISWAGSLPSIQNSVNGDWHRDVYSLFDDEKLEMSLPIFYLTVLVPLVDIDKNNGATEFIVGSHKSGKSGNRVIAEAKVGSAIICDGMVYHRGRANMTNTERHMLYVVYCKKWYNDYL